MLLLLFAAANIGAAADAAAVLVPPLPLQGRAEGQPHAAHPHPYGRGALRLPPLPLQDQEPEQPQDPRAQQTPGGGGARELLNSVVSAELLCQIQLFLT